LVNDFNVKGEDSLLVADIVPADQTGCTLGEPARPSRGTYDFGTCTGANLPIPSPGDFVEVVGLYVLNKSHGWMEIHPTWSILSSDLGGAPPPTASTS